jgi:hypothetical protein
VWHAYLAMAPQHVKKTGDNRDVYTILFVLACLYPFLLLFFQGVRDFHQWAPGGMKLWLACDVAVIIICACVLR